MVERAEERPRPARAGEYGLPGAGGVLVDRRRSLSVTHPSIRHRRATSADMSPLRRREFLRSSAGVLAGGAGAVLLGACGSSGGTRTSGTGPGGKPPAHPTGTLRVAVYDLISTLDPSRASGGDISVTRNIYDSLVRYHPTTGAVQPSLATSWETSADGLEWTFHLRPGVTFHDGEPFDATAVRKSIEYYTTSRGSVFAALFAQPKHIDDSDPQVVRLVLNEPRGGMLSEQMFMKIISPKAIAKATTDAGVGADPVGSGPFKFVQRSGNGGVVLEAFTDYWGEGPYLERLELQQITDPDARVSALLAGDVDLVPHLTPPQVRQMQGQGSRVRLASADIWTVGYVMLRADTGPLQDVRVRQAINHAIDRETLARTVLLGAVSPADSVYPKTLPGYVSQGDAYKFDPQLSKSLLAEAGVNPGDVTVNIASLALLPWAEAVAGMLRDVGFDARSRVFEVTVFTREVTKPHPTYNADATSHGWATENLIFGIMPAVSQYTGKDVSTLVAKLPSVAGAARDAVVADLQKAFAEDAFYLPVYFDREHDALKPNIAGYAPPLDGFSGYYGTTFLTNG
jgi:ABC-type transport system substrate-binding protein